MLQEIGYIFLIFFGIFIVFCVLQLFSTNQRLRRYVKYNCNVPTGWWEKTNYDIFLSINITFAEKDGWIQTLSHRKFMSLRRVRKQIGNPLPSEWIVDIDFSDSTFRDSDEYSRSHLLHSPTGWQITDYRYRSATLQDKVGGELNINFDNVPMPGTGIDGEILRIARDYRNVDHYKYDVITKAFADALLATKSTHRSPTLEALREQVANPDDLFSSTHRPVIKLPVKEKLAKDDKQREEVTADSLG